MFDNEITQKKFRNKTKKKLKKAEK